MQQSQIPQEKQAILARALAMPDDPNSQIVIKKAKERGWLKDEPVSQELPQQEDGLGKKAARIGLGFAEGVGEFANVPAIPGAIERAGRTAYGMATEPRQPGEGLFGKLSRIGTKAEKESVLPMPSVGETAAGLRAFGRSILSPTKAAQIYDEEMQAQKDYEKEFVSEGARTAGQIAAAVPGVVQAGKTLIAGAKGLARTGKAGVDLAKKAFRSGQIVDDTPALLKEVLQQTDGEIVEAILQRPEKVKELIAQKQFSVDDLAKTLTTKLNEARETLGARVQQFRQIAQGDTARSIDKVEGLADGLRSVLAKSELRGVQMLPPKERQMLEAVIQIADEARISPDEALKAVDAIDAVVDYGSTGKSGSKFIQLADYALKGARKDLKNAIRNASPDAAQWAKADDAYSKFIDPAQEVLRKLNGSNRNTFVSGLFNKNKEPVVEQLSHALGFVPDGEFGSYKKAFFDSLADIKAAGALKARELGTADPLADNAARIIAKWEKFGERVGAIGGGAFGSVTGFQIPSFGGAFGGGGGGLGGAYVGGKIGGLAGRVYGERLANPMRLLDIAIESKNKQVSSLAKDLKPILKDGGEAAVQAVLMSIGPSRVVQDLIKTIQESQPKGEK